MQHFSLVPLARSWQGSFPRLQILVAEAFRYVGDIRPGTLQHRSERMTRRMESNSKRKQQQIGKDKT